MRSDEANLSSTSICLKLVHPEVTAMDIEAQAALAKQLVTLLADQEVAFDIGGLPDGACQCLAPRGAANS